MSSERRVAVITGAAGGLGAAFAQALAADGLAVAVVDIKDCSATLAAIHAAGGEADDFTCDLTDPKAVEQLGREVEERFGRGRCAGQQCRAL